MRRWVLLLPLLLLVTSALPAWASPEGPEAGPEAAHGHEKGLLDIDLREAAVAIAVFVVLLLVLTKFAWRPILDGLKAREATIQKAVDDAQAASARAQAVVKEYEGRLATAADEGRAILEEARRDAQALKASIEADAKRSVEETTARAVREIDQARAAAWDGLVRDAARLTSDAAARIIRKTLDAQGHAALVDEVVAEVAAARRSGRA